MERSGYVAVLLCVVIVCIAESTIIRTPQPPEPTRPLGSTRPPVSLEHPLDLAFIMDTTGSMSSYINSAKANIRQIVDAIVRSSQSRVRLALVEYRDHPPQDRSFVTRTHDFTESVNTMKSWLNNAQARGGGDTPEAVADALNEATKLSWNVESTKISIMISDAPPHALDPSRDSSFHNGCPDEHDPMQTVRELARLGITLYTAGVEPSINQYKDFFEALAFKTGGQYVPMRNPYQLINVIIGGAQEELSLNEFTSEVRNEVERVIANGGEVDENRIAQTVYQRLNARGATAMHLTKNNEALDGPSSTAKMLANLTSMADVREQLGNDDDYQRQRYVGSLRPRVHYDMPPMLESSVSISHGVEPRYSIGRRGPLYEATSFSHSRSSHPRRPTETYSTIESGVSLDQITRLVKKETSRLK